MKNIKSFYEFINEELKHLPPPSDEETDDALNNMTPENALLKSTKINYFKGVKDAIKRGAWVDIGEDHNERDDDQESFDYSDGKTSLMIAVENNNFEIVKYLIEECKADINEYFNDDEENEDITSLYYAVLNDNFEMVKYLVEHGSEVNEFILDKAEENCNEQTIEFLKNHLEEE